MLLSIVFAIIFANFFEIYTFFTQNRSSRLNLTAKKPQKLHTEGKGSAKPKKNHNNLANVVLDKSFYWLL